MKELDSSSFKKVLNEDFCVVDFSASWCGPCRALKPIMEEIEMFNPDINFYSLDVDECEDVAKEYKIFSIPCIKIFKKGEAVDTMVGLYPQEEILEFINKNK